MVGEIKSRLIGLTALGPEKGLGANAEPVGARHVGNNEVVR
jgi:hypothetical protein